MKKKEWRSNFEFPEIVNWTKQSKGLVLSFNLTDILSPTWKCNPSKHSQKIAILNKSQFDDNISNCTNHKEQTTKVHCLFTSTLSAQSAAGFLTHPLVLRWWRRRRRAIVMMMMMIVKEKKIQTGIVAIYSPQTRKQPQQVAAAKARTINFIVVYVWWCWAIFNSLDGTFFLALYSDNEKVIMAFWFALVVHFTCFSIFFLFFFLHKRINSECSLNFPSVSQISQTNKNKLIALAAANLQRAKSSWLVVCVVI